MLKDNLFLSSDARLCVQLLRQRHRQQVCSRCRPVRTTRASSSGGLDFECFFDRMQGQQIRSRSFSLQRLVRSSYRSQVVQTRGVSPLRACGDTRCRDAMM